MRNFLMTRYAFHKLCYISSSLEKAYAQHQTQIKKKTALKNFNLQKNLFRVR